MPTSLPTRNISSRLPITTPGLQRPGPLVSQTSLQLKPMPPKNHAGVGGGVVVGADVDGAGDGPGTVEGCGVVVGAAVGTGLLDGEATVI